tara:strand:- start:1071 stop:1748 length:678 start_codon:yes stop_codon:yes gene_type:complete
MKEKEVVVKNIESVGDSHSMTSIENMLNDDAFDLSDDEKIAIIEDYFKKIMLTLGLDLSDDSLNGTPHRVAKMYVKEIFAGINPISKPKISLFENKYQYGKMLVEKNISLYSFCEHHFLPFYGTVDVAYISSGKVIGLSKIHRIVNYFAKRPQVQERLTIQVFNELKNILKTEDVAILIDAKHLCVASRGIKDVTSSTVTIEAGGVFKDTEKWTDFMSIIGRKKS